MDDVMNMTGTTLTELKRDMHIFNTHTKYAQHDFCDATILYAFEDSPTKKSTMTFKVLRPCDMEDYHEKTILNETMDVSHDLIPASILQNIDPDDRTSANVAFIFDEGTREQQIYFLDKLASHSLRTSSSTSTDKTPHLPIDSFANPSFGGMHYLAENLLYLALQDESVHYRPRMTIRVTDNGAKKIVGFTSMLNHDTPSDYLDVMYKLGLEIFNYMIDDSGVTVIFRAPESDGIKPVYALSVSDCGWGSSRITPGYILDEEQKFWYAADKAISLNANAIQKSIDEALTACDKLFTKQHAKLIKISSHMFDCSPAKLVQFASANVAKIPDFKKTIGAKAWKKSLEAYQSQQREEQISELQLRTELATQIGSTMTAPTAKPLFTTKVAPVLMGIC